MESGGRRRKKRNVDSRHKGDETWRPRLSCAVLGCRRAEFDARSLSFRAVLMWTDDAATKVVSRHCHASLTADRCFAVATAAAAADDRRDSDEVPAGRSVDPIACFSNSPPALEDGGTNATEPHHVSRGSGYRAQSNCHHRSTEPFSNREQSVPIQLAQCRFPELAISNAEILIYF